MTRSYAFNPNEFTPGQLAYRLKISVSGAYALLNALKQIGAVEEIKRGRYKLAPQSKHALFARAAAD